MDDDKLRGKRLHKKEHVVILITIIAVYLIQLLVTKVYLKLVDYDAFEWYLFIPSIKFLISYVPIISWALMCFVNVTWIDLWKVITLLFLIYFIPFEIIVVLVGILKPLYLFKIWVWIIISILSLILGFFIFMKVDIERLFA